MSENLKDKTHNVFEGAGIFPIDIESFLELDIKAKRAEVYKITASIPTLDPQYEADVYKFIAFNLMDVESTQMSVLNLAEVFFAHKSHWCACGMDDIGKLLTPDLRGSRPVYIGALVLLLSRSNLDVVGAAFVIADKLSSYDDSGIKIIGMDLRRLLDGDIAAKNEPRPVA